MNFYNNKPLTRAPFAQQQQQPKLDPEKFKALAHNLNDNLLSQLAQRARLQGISEEDIQKGMEIIHSL